MPVTKLLKQILLYSRTLELRAFCSTNVNGQVKIGSVAKSYIPSRNPELIPISYFSEACSQEIRTHLQWIMKKDLLGQDVFLLGLPGPLRRRVALQYLELTRREIEYIVLSRDTTESDLKQRREIVASTARYNDQSAVKAAIEGRVLILDGVEKAERNVLPILNNLLENREVQLEDGRFLVSPERYDKLLAENSKEVLDKWNLVRVSENFRVIALGLPVPQFLGHPLDPPFRSRFQSRDIRPTFQEQFSELASAYPNIPSQELQKLITLSYTFLSDESTSLGIPKFPIENLERAAQLLNVFPNLPSRLVFELMYPFRLMLSSEGTQFVEDTLKKFHIGKQPLEKMYSIKENTASDNLASVELEVHGMNFCIEVPKYPPSQAVVINQFIENDYHNSILSDMLLTHACSDFCLIGPRGTGKTVLVKKFASLLNYPCEMVMLYKDMTARDLLQHRITNLSGDTVWEFSNLVKAALKGKVAILDGLHRLHQSTLSVLQRLIHDRELQLYDGTRLLRHDRYEAIKSKYELTDSEMEKKNIYSIHPSFRIIALAEPPKIDSYKEKWLTPEVLTMFLFHNLRPLSFEEEKHVIEQLVGPASDKMQVILNLAHTLRNSKDAALVSISNSLSTRQLKRIAQRLAMFPHQDIHTLISQTCLLKFLPQLTRQAIEKVFEDIGIEKGQDNQTTKRTCKVTDKEVCIGNTKISLYDPQQSIVKVPNILFYDNQEHLAIMEAMLQDFILGENLLLIGNQGVGKNKIVDRFLQLLNRPREYIQLHRDTTVQSLTQQPNVVSGKIIYEDSPLVKAVKNGHVLVVDEADKAPTHVTCILKALVESGEMVLSDGRRIVHHSDPQVSSDNGNCITMHPHFRMMILANRPGFPFLGNDFFATLGDIFSCHAVENPSMDSEISMLRQYGPNVPSHILQKLARLFSDLRSLSDNGIIAYPYSMREAINITKHLEKYPNEGLPVVLKNIFDFDNYNTELKNTLLGIFNKHGIPFGAKTGKISVAKSFHLSKPQLCGTWSKGAETISCPTTENLRVADPYKLEVNHTFLDSTEARSATFTEQQRHWKLPLDDHNVPTSLATAKHGNTDIIHVATANPITVMSLNSSNNSVCTIDLSNSFPSIRRGFKPDLKLVSLVGKQENDVLLYEKHTNQVFIVNCTTGSITEVNMSNAFALTMEKLSNILKVESKRKTFNLCADLSKKNFFIFYSDQLNNITVLDLNKGTMNAFQLPEAIKHVSAIDENSLILIGENNNYLADIFNFQRWKISHIEETFNETNFDDLQSASAYNISEDTLCSSLNLDKVTPAAVLASHKNYVSLVVDLVNSSSGKVFQVPRQTAILKPSAACILQNNGQIIRKVSGAEVPQEMRLEGHYSIANFLEITTIGTLTCSYVLLPESRIMTSVARWLVDTPDSHLLIGSTKDENLVTVDNEGYIRLWETGPRTLQNSLNDWLQVTGIRDHEQITIEQGNLKDVSSPKHGKVDPTGAPHVGGNTWAGGTGGRDTAGLGGKGGPYRLDAGHNVFQIPDSEKDSVPPEVKRAAREMAIKAYKDKLKEIDMSEYDAKLYEQFSQSVTKQVHSLKTILDSLQAKSKERQWLRHQTSGELDDTKLVEGITGEKSIYRRRAEQEPELGAPQEKPKKLRLLVDVSGSMYRFNGHDNRLERELESLVLVMEAFDGYKDKFQFDIVGHSGEDFCISFSKFDDPPKNNKERLNLLKKMHAHSQFCMSGDNTLRATKYAIEDILKEEGDEYFLVAMSDANFDRYGISPKSFGQLLTSQPKVNSFAIFIGTLGDEAAVLQKELPPGRGFVCLDTKQLPQILQRIFTSALLHEQ